MLTKTILGVVTTLAMVAGPLVSSTTGSPPVQAGCSARLSPADLSHAEPGAVICFGSLAKSARLEIDKGGTKDKPITYDGQGKSVGGLDVDADYVIVQNFTMNKPSAPGIEVHGNGITVQNNTVTAPHGGDGDGLRFFGNNITIKANTISQTDDSTGAHADCMQTFATGDDDVASQHVLIDSNKCLDVDNMCLIGEGPNSAAGDGSGIGVSEDWTFSNNDCKTNRANQTIFLDDVQHVTMTGNTWEKGPNHAIGLQNKATDAHVSNNKLDPSIDCEVGIDTSSKPGYQGPEPRCDP